MSALRKLPPIPPEWRAARRILAVRLDNLGDVLVTSPGLRAIKESLPDAEITLLASPAGAQVGRLVPGVDRTMVYRAPWVDPWRQLALDPARERRAIGGLRSRGFDGAIIFTSFRQSPLPAAYMVYLAGIPLRHGATWDSAGSLLTSRHRPAEQLMHEAERHLETVAALGLWAASSHLGLRVPQLARARVRTYLNAMGPVGGPLVVMHPGCSMPARTYPWTSFAAAADQLAAALGARVILTGSAEEMDLAAQICASMQRPAISLAGMLPLAELCALIETADLVVTNNTGPMHIAAALKTPVVALFALTNPPEQWGPWRAPCRVLFREVPCRICYSRVCPTDHACLRGVTPAAIVQAAAELLDMAGDRQQQLEARHV